MITDQDRNMARQCAHLFGGNGRSEREQVELAAEELGKWRQSLPLLEWHKGPAQDGEGTAGKDEETGAPLFYDGDRLLIIIETNGDDEMTIVDISCDEDYFEVRDASTGDSYDAWGPESWSWWAKFGKRNLPQVAAVAALPSIAPSTAENP